MEVSERRWGLSILIAFLMVATPFAILASVPPVAAATENNGPLAANLAPAVAGTDTRELLGSKLDPGLADFMRTSPGPFKTYVIVSDRAAVNEFLTAEGLPMIEGKEIPGVPTTRIMELDAKQVYLLAENQGVMKIMRYERPEVSPPMIDEPLSMTRAEISPPAIEDYDVNVVHGAVDAWSNGWTGDGVKIAVIDTGFDLGHPDLQGQQARYRDPSSPYLGWPIAYDDYAAMLWSFGIIGSWVADTSTVVPQYGDYVYFDGKRWMVEGLEDVLGNPVSSASGMYHIGYHTDANLAALWGDPVGVLVVDSVGPGTYDMVFVDVTHDFDFTNDKACTLGDEISYFDFYDAGTGVEDYSSWDAGDGFADLSGGMVYWISDGMNVLPGSNWTYGAAYVANPGDAVAFMGEFTAGESHGTMTSSAALAASNSMSGQLGGMAPDAKLISIPFTGDVVNAWLFAELGADGVFNSGDEANIVSNSYGWSDTAVDAGYEALDEFATMISLDGYQTLWCWSTGNGGPGYGTAHSPVDASSVHVGAGTTMQYRYLLGYEPYSGYQKWGDVIPFSNSGPGRNGKLNAEIIASGAYSLEPAPLNQYDATGWIGDGSMHFQIGSGTSHATPTVAGGAALGYQAYMSLWMAWPNIDRAKAWLMAAADDMHFDPLKQGAGWLNASRYATLMSASGGVVSFAPAGWTEPVFDKGALYPGGLYGTKYETYPNFILPGDSDDQNQLTTFNYEPTPVNINITGKILLRTGWNNIAITTPDAGSIYEDITSRVPASTDLLKVTMYMNMSTFDPDLDYFSDVAYWLEIHDWVDIDADTIMDISGGEWELFRYSVDGSDCNYNQIMLKDPIERTNDGLIVRVRSILGMAGIDIHLQLDYYELQDFPWATFRLMGTGDPWTSGLDFTMPSWSSIAWEANFAVPADAPVGTYAAAVYVDDGERVQCIPVMINVPSPEFEFQFGGPSYFDTPYNNDVTGIADRGWRFEVGDWRMYWCVPDLAVLPPDWNSMLVVTVNWTELPTDVNLHVLAAVPSMMWAYTGIFDPPFGPGLIQGPVASSDEKYLGAGTFGVWTSTGGPREVIGAPNDRTELGRQYDYGVAQSQLYSWSFVGIPGPFSIVTRCPVMAGNSSSDMIKGYTKWITMWDWTPTEVRFASSQPGSPSDPGYVPLVDTIPAEYDMMVTGTVDVKGGGVAPVAGQEWPMEPIWQDSLSGSFVEALANAMYTRPISVGDTNMLRVSVEEVANAPDIDMGLWYDMDYDGVADLSEPYWYVGAGGSTESLTLDDPAPGQYLVKVLGYTVTGTPGYFSLAVQTGILGATIEAAGLEATAGTGIHAFNISYSLPAKAGVYSGAATFGFMGAADMFKIPVTIEVIDEGKPVVENLVPADGAELASNYLTVEFDLNDMVEFYSGLDSSSVAIAVDGNHWGSLASVAGDHVSMVLPFLMAEGDHTVTVWASDMYGNWADPVSSTFSVNTVIERFSVEFADPSTSSAIADGSTVALTQVVLRGWTDADAGVDVTSPAYSNSTTASGTGYFELFVDLAEGTNVVTLVTTNGAGVSANMYKTIVSDTVCALTVNAVSSPTASASLDLSGTAEVGATVTVNGAPAAVTPTGTWSITVSLSEGPNVLLVEATDAVGNIASTSVPVTLVLDTVCELTVDPVQSPVKTNSILLTGMTEVGASVSAAGVAATVDGIGTWSVTVPLAEGTNVISIQATDLSSNIALRSVTVIRDTTPPSLSITSPTSGATVDEPSVTVNGTTDAGAYVYVNGVLASDGSTAWTAAVSLLEGDNTITVTAMDALSNSVTQTRTVTYDPPYATPDDLTDLGQSLQDALDQLNDSLQQDVDTVDEKADDLDSFSKMLMYLMLALFVAAIVIISLVWFVLNGKIRSPPGELPPPPTEEVGDAPSTDVEREFEQLEKEIDKEERS